jgi:signal peptidase I
MGDQQQNEKSEIKRKLSKKELIIKVFLRLLEVLFIIFSINSVFVSGPSIISDYNDLKIKEGHTTAIMFLSLGLIFTLPLVVLMIYLSNKYLDYRKLKLGSPEQLDEAQRKRESRIKILVRLYQAYVIISFVSAIFIDTPSLIEIVKKYNILEIVLGVPSFIFFVFFLNTVIPIFFIESYLKYRKLIKVDELQKPENKTKTIFMKVLWIVVAIIIGGVISFFIQSSLDFYVHLTISDSSSFYQNPPKWYFRWSTILSWVGSILAWLTIIFITYKKVGDKTAKVFLVIFLAIIISSLFFERVTMRNDALQPYLHTGDSAIVTKTKNIHKGDIAMVNTGDKDIVSLVIGLEGDKIELKNGTFFINGKELEAVYDFGTMSYIDDKSKNQIIVPQDHFFGIPTKPKKDNLKQIELYPYLYKKSDLVGVVIFPKRKITLEKYTSPDSCNGYSPISCPEGSKYYCPSKGKPFCCTTELVNGFCLE